MDTHAPGASAPVLANQPTIFLFHDTEVRTIDRNGQVWFVAGDVAKALGYADAVQMTRVLDDDEAALHTMQIRSENGTIQTREVTILSESGLYHALLKSRKPEARPFRRWVTQEVLPAIRRGAQSSQIPTHRLLLAWDANGQWHSQSLPANACVIDPSDPEQLACFLREYVPADHLGEVLAIAAQRLLQNRHHPIDNA
ncbi:BRO-N domain-containing protein [Acidithiobacillus caldus]